MTLPVSALTRWLRDRNNRRRQAQVPRPRLPTVAERRYLGALLVWAGHFEDEVMRLVLDLVPEVREDALLIGPRQRGRVRRALGPVSVALNERARQIPLTQVGAAVADHVTREATRVIGLKNEDVLPMGHTVDVWRRENVGLIKSMQDDMLGRVEDTLSAYDGIRVEDLRDELQSTFGVTRSRAALIARDQTLKLNAQLTEDVHTSAGITEYIWSTSKDGAVRTRHAELEGKRFKYSDPPVVDEKHDRRANPGGDYQCRCVAVPVLPELD